MNDLWWEWYLYVFFFFLDDMNDIYDMSFCGYAMLHLKFTEILPCKYFLFHYTLIIMFVELFTIYLAFEWKMDKGKEGVTREWKEGPRRCGLMLCFFELDWIELNLIV